MTKAKNILLLTLLGATIWAAAKPISHSSLLLGSGVEPVPTVKGLMDLLGIDLADLIKTGKVPGIEVQKDDLVLDPEELLPPPHVVARVTAVQVRAGQIVQFFGDSTKTPDWRFSAANYMAYRENRLRFGKLTMSDTDLVLIDMDPKDPFDFYLDHYKEQLVAGYTKETPSFGLRVYMRDYKKLHRATTNGSAHR